MSFYFFQKERLKAIRIRKSENSNKLKAKTERIIELKKENEEKNRTILQRIKKKEKFLQNFDELKKSKLNSINKTKYEKIKKMQSLKLELGRIEKEKAMDILGNQSSIIKRGYQTKIIRFKKISHDTKSPMSLINFEKNLKDFTKKMNCLKDQSIYKKSPKERFQIYKQLKREEAERKKRELEEKLESMKQIILTLI